MTRAAEALAAGDWSAARSGFAAALAQDESPEALSGLGTALFWLGETDAAVAATERAYAGFRRRQDPASAAFEAIGLFLIYGSSLGNLAAASGWLGRLARLVDGFDLAPLRGWVALCRAGHANATGHPTSAERHADEALESARRDGDPDLELCALSELGFTLVQSGRLAEGFALLDEAMAGALGGEGYRRETVVFTGCRSITSCCRALEYARAVQWIRAADGFIRRFGNLHLYTTCRTEFGYVLFCQGRWGQAEQELRSAMDMGRTGEPLLFGEAVSVLAELRVAQGRLSEAAQLLVGLEDHPAAMRPRAQLLLRRGEAGLACGLLHRRLEALGPECTPAAALAELTVEAEIDAGDIDAAAERARHLAKIGERTDSEVVRAHGVRAVGRARLAAGDHEVASGELARAMDMFIRLGMPFETARTHLLRGRAVRDVEPAGAVEEFRAALAGFASLGAACDADEAAALLRELGVRTAHRGPRNVKSLTGREQEVLSLIGEGLSNTQIAQRLFLSRKTVEHHVRGLLTKLGVSSRTEAVAYSLRHNAPTE